MVANKMEVEDVMELLKKKTVQIQERFDKNYARGNENVDFKEKFLEKEKLVGEAFCRVENEGDTKNVPKLLVEANKELESLEKMFSVSSMFVLPLVHEICDELIWSYEERLTALKKNYCIHKKVKGLDKVSPPIKTAGGATEHQEVVEVKTVPAKPLANKKFVKSDVEKAVSKVATSLSDRQYVLENLNGVALTLTERIIKSKRVLLNGLTNCSIKLPFYLEFLQIIFCSNIQILVSFVSRSIIRNTQNSVISIDGNNTRIEYCDGVLFKIPKHLDVIVKESYNLEFAHFQVEYESKKEADIIGEAMKIQESDKKDTRSLVIGKTEIETRKWVDCLDEGRK